MPDAAQSLQEAIGFGELDLAANRSGRSSAAQRAKFGQWEEQRRGYEDTNHRFALIAGAVLLVGALVLLGFALPRAFSLPAPLADKDVVSCLFFSGAMALFGTLALVWGASRARGPVLQAPEYVQLVEGHVLFNPSQDPDWETIPNFDLQGLHFTVTDQVARAFVPGARYRLYYVPTVYHVGGLVMKSLVILSAELALDP